MADIKMINNYYIKDETARNEIETLRAEIPVVPTNVGDFNNDIGYATETYVNDAIAGIEINGGNVDLSNYALKTDLESYSRTTHAHDDRYYLKYQVDAKIAGLGIAGYAKLEDLQKWGELFALKEHTHDNYVTKDDLGDINAILDNINGEAI